LEEGQERVMPADVAKHSSDDVVISAKSGFFFGKSEKNCTFDKSIPAPTVATLNLILN
jgi:hypothetical protein